MDDDGLESFKAALRSATLGYGRRIGWCAEHRISSTTVSEITTGKKLPSQRVLDAMGWRRRVFYEPKEAGE